MLRIFLGGFFCLVASLRAQEATGRKSPSEPPLFGINGSGGVDAPIANNIYKALNVRLERRYSFGLNRLMNYTWW